MTDNELHESLQQAVNKYDTDRVVKTKVKPFKVNKINEEPVKNRGYIIIDALLFIVFTPIILLYKLGVFIIENYAIEDED